MAVDDKSGAFGHEGKTVTLDVDMIDRETWVTIGKRWMLQHGAGVRAEKCSLTASRWAFPEADLFQRPKHS